METSKIDLISMLGRRNAQAQRQAPRFRQLMGMPLSKFWHPFTGFDVVRLDDELLPPKGQSLRSCIKKRYGKEAAELVEYLILL